MKIGNLVPIHLQTWPPQAILVSDWLISKKSSSLKPLTEPYIGASHQALVHLAKQLQRRFFKIEPPETEWPVMAMFISGWALNEHSL
jgi:hypothetical protein